MARNEEKANAMLNRWVSATLIQQEQKRPYLASLCEKLPEAEKWRAQIIGEIGKKVYDIQNASLGEHRLRELNDEINKLIREKRHWENRILELDGPNYKRGPQKYIDEDGKEVPGQHGYKYFGAAKNLPGVREMLARQDTAEPTTRAELSQRVNVEYFGLRDEDDGVLEEVEKAAEDDAVNEFVQEWRDVGGMGLREHDDLDEFLELERDGFRVPNDVDTVVEDANGILLEKRKREIMAKYGK